MTYPVVSISAACANNGNYDIQTLVRCVSNLYAAGFNRLAADVYWDPARTLWTFCPAQIPTSADQAAAAGARLQANVQLNTTVFPETSTGLQNPEFGPRNATVYGIGPYTCSSYDRLDVLASLILSYMKSTDNTLQASVGTLLFNTHVASPLQSPLAPAPMPANASLPSGPGLIGSVFAATLGDYLYTPPQLASERANIGTSWNSSYVMAIENPDAFYYTTNIGPGGVESTPDGWPSESYIILKDGKRLLAGIGRVDPQLQFYNLDAENSTVFVDGEIDTFVNATITPNGTVTDGCFFSDPGVQTSFGNASWAILDQTSWIAEDFNDPRTRSDALAQSTISNITSCGISPLLNVTLENSTAWANVGPYQQFGFDSVWSWAPGQPHNDSDTSDAPLSYPVPDDDTSNNDHFRCAVMSARAAGRWFVTYCEEHFPVACRDPNDPFRWTVEDGTATYNEAYRSCPSGKKFAVPRTALENRHLLNAVNTYLQANRSGSPIVWIDYNSKAAESCWVPGSNSTCPYRTTEAQDDASIIVPTVAAIVIIILALATLLVKCGANRSNSRKRRKFYDGWDYEGVPS